MENSPQNIRGCTDIFYSVVGLLLYLLLLLLWLANARFVRIALHTAYRCRVKPKFHGSSFVVTFS